MKQTLVKLIVMAGAAGLIAVGCDNRVEVQPTAPTAAAPAPGAPAEVQVETPPPPVQVETQPPSPGPDYVWIGGAWSWGGSRWEWEKGRWDHSPHPGAVWVAHRYDPPRHVFVRGGWH